MHANAQEGFIAQYFPLSQQPKIIATALSFPIRERRAARNNFHRIWAK
jgi:hypothetical protein